MKSINLLPKKSFWSIWFAPLIILLVIGYITAALVLYLRVSAIEHQRETVSAEMERTERNIAALTEQRMPDPRLVLLRQFQETVSLLESTRAEWLPAVHVLTSSLPSRAVLEQVKAESDTITVEARFPTQQSVVDYARVTRSSDLFEHINITSITAQQQVMMEEPPESALMEVSHYRAMLTYVLAIEGEDVTP